MAMSARHNGRKTMTATQTLPTLYKGDTGADVRWAQYRLVRQTLSYTDIDGVFGTVTESGVREFQRFSSLVVDGVIGPLTWQALRGDSERPPTLKRDSSGEVVRSLQESMNMGRGEFTPPGAEDLAVDGDFGPRTEAAVRAMQSYNGLPGDGVVGMATWAIPIHAAGQVLADMCNVPGPG
jgi:peptidoglycan hydrolase-like protein with peptidoglycan-binding domain